MSAYEADKWSLDEDLRFITQNVGDEWKKLDGAKIFITGGTGFIGRWLLESLLHAQKKFGLNVHATILTRNPDAFRLKAPHICDLSLFTLLSGDVNTFEFPEGEFTHLIHAATDASAELNENNPLLMFDTVLEGTRQALNFAVAKNVRRVLYLSSGAVYGPQPWDVTNVPEDWSGSPDCTRAVNAYAEGKRAAEMLCAIYAKQFNLQISTARIFALLGPHLTLDIHFAAGNFIRDAIEGKKIIVKSSGLACRSYLYAADLTAMLWHMLLRAPAGRSYNVGSSESISIRELAQRVAELLGKSGYEILGQDDKGWNPGRYVPDTTRLENELGLTRTITLDQAIVRTAIWNGWKPWH